MSRIDLRQRRVAVRMCIAGLFVLQLSGCALLPTWLIALVEPKRCEELPIEIHLQGSPLLNLGNTGQSAPVEVLAYLLHERATFDEMDFDSLWHEGEEKLGDDLIQRVSLTVFPGADKIYTLQIPKVAYIGLVPIFRQPGRDGWKRVLDLREQAENCRPEQLHISARARLHDNMITQLDIEGGD